MWSNPQNCTSWWSPGPSIPFAGIGITACSELLSKFDGTHRWEVVFPGRAAVLHLTGSLGALDIFSVYFHTGDSIPIEDLLEAGYDPVTRPPSSAELRQALRRRISNHIKPRHSFLSLLSGGFNFVIGPGDRKCIETSGDTGARDRWEVNSWRRLVEKRHGSHELHQPALTYASPSSRSRLDRIYCNQYGVEYLDRTISCTALNWVAELSKHHPVSFRKNIPADNPAKERPIPNQVLDHPDWPRQVALAWHDLIDEHPETTALTQLKLLKTEMRVAERAIGTCLDSTPPAENLEDRIGSP